MRAHKTQNALAFMTIFHCLISYRGSLALAVNMERQKIRTSGHGGLESHFHDL